MSSEGAVTLVCADADRVRVDMLRLALQKAGLITDWGYDGLPDQGWRAAMQERLRISDVVLIVWTKGLCNTNQTESGAALEVGHAVATQKHIVDVCLDDCAKDVWLIRTFSTKFRLIDWDSGEVVERENDQHFKSLVAYLRLHVRDRSDDLTLTINERSIAQWLRANKLDHLNATEVRILRNRITFLTSEECMARAFLSALNRDASDDVLRIHFDSAEAETDVLRISEYFDSEELIGHGHIRDRSLNSILAAISYGVCAHTRFKTSWNFRSALDLAKFYCQQRWVENGAVYTIRDARDTKACVDFFFMFLDRIVADYPKEKVILYLPLRHFGSLIDYQWKPKSLDGRLTTSTCKPDHAVSCLLSALTDAADANRLPGRVSLLIDAPSLSAAEYPLCPPTGLVLILPPLSEADAASFVNDFMEAALPPPTCRRIIDATAGSLPLLILIAQSWIWLKEFREKSGDVGSREPSRMENDIRAIIEFIRNRAEGGNISYQQANLPLSITMKIQTQIDNLMKSARVTLLNESQGVIESIFDLEPIIKTWSRTLQNVYRIGLISLQAPKEFALDEFAAAFPQFELVRPGSLQIAIKQGLKSIGRLSQVSVQ